MLAVLTGRPPAEVAAAADPAGMAVEDLVDAVESYRAAGLAALRRNAERRAWLQVRVDFPDYSRAAEVVGEQLLPLLRRAEDSGVLRSWWYVRKAPHWRLRFGASAGRDAAMRTLVTDQLNGLARRGLLAGWSTGIYEPEAAAFGGLEGMAIAHRFFHADSSRTLEYLTSQRRDRDRGTGTPTEREVSLLLCAALLRAAGQDWHEQGDVWRRVAAMRPLPGNSSPEGFGGTVEKVRVLLAVDSGPATRTGPVAAPGGDPFAPLRPWLASATETGTALADCAGREALHRGLRDVLAHHMIFHWNRLGLPAATQAVLAHAATSAVLGVPLGRADVVGP